MFGVPFNAVTAVLVSMGINTQKLLYAQYIHGVAGSKHSHPIICRWSDRTLDILKPYAFVVSVYVPVLIIGIDAILLFNASNTNQLKTKKR